MNSGNLNFLEPSGSLQACEGIKCFYIFFWLVAPCSFVDGSTMSMTTATCTVRKCEIFRHKPASCHNTEDQSLCQCRVTKSPTVTQLMIQDVVFVGHRYRWEVQEGSVPYYSARARKECEIHFRRPGTWSLRFSWHATQRWSAAVYWRSGKHSEDLFFSVQYLNLEEGTDTFSWNVGKQLPTDAV